ncbi:endoribonuclease rege-1 [Nilaparvata lugens]|uniref:endoribonuclease rege-1 n=1 Tax=Nilaparvata lugens TaxID=108931 RepID=UPI00193EA67A|nr:endoribonuclease rege-1 [Nilaparvata lugens]
MAKNRHSTIMDLGDDDDSIVIVDSVNTTVASSTTAVDSVNTTVASSTTAASPRKFQSTNPLLNPRESYIKREHSTSEDFIRFSNHNLSRRLKSGVKSEDFIRFSNHNLSRRLKSGGKSVRKRYFNYNNSQVKSNIYGELFENEELNRFSNTNQNSWNNGSNCTQVSSNIGQTSTNSSQILDTTLSNNNRPWSNASTMLSNVVEDDPHVFEPSSSNGSSPYSRVGMNVFIPGSMSPKTGPRPVIIDGCNVAFSHGCNTHFSVKGIKICVDYFRRLGNKTYVVLPNHRKRFLGDLANAWERDGTLVVTPSRRINNNYVTSAYDRYVIQCAAAMDGIIVSKNQFRDLMGINPLWDATIEKRLLMLSWVEDILIFPVDPLGRNGVNLTSFLMF